MQSQSCETVSVKISWQACGSGKRRLADGDTHAVEAIGKLRLAPFAAATQGAPWWKTGLAAKFAQTRSAPAGGFGLRHAVESGYPVGRVGGRPDIRIYDLRFTNYDLASYASGVAPS
jgi:hypothetical protein